MIINSSNVGMESARTYRSVSTRKLSVTANVVSYAFSDKALEKEDLLGNGTGESLQTDGEEKKTAEQEETDNALQRMQNYSTAISSRIQSITEGTEAKGIEQIRQQCILYLWRLLFGGERASRLADTFNVTAENNRTQTGTMQYMELRAVEEVSYQEEESMSFSTNGTVKTADGREISFQMNVGMSHRFAQYYKNESQNVVAMCDPLVINLEGNVTGLSDQKFFFDLDCDGTEEEISTLEAGNAFLALDRNGDGTINDGSELFGAKTGDGFADLARYDEDGNGWIDEADSIFDRLKIWVKDEDGNDRLYTLKEKGLGAIYLGSLDTDYTLRSNATGEVNGRIRKNGVFLYENGMAGTIAHIDMAKHTYDYENAM